MTNAGGAAHVPHSDTAESVYLDGERILTVRDVARALPDPDTLARGTLLLVFGAAAHGSRGPSLASRLLRVFSGTKPVPRALRCSALVARGYIDVGAAVSETTRDDVAWGYCPGPRTGGPS